MINGYKFDPNHYQQGGNGRVYKCEKDGRYYALKLFTTNHEQYLHEVNHCQMLKKHINIVDSVEAMEWEGQKYIVFEYCKMGLVEYLKTNPGMSLEARMQLFVQIVCAFNSIQADLKTTGMTFQHRDIKPDNIMMGELDQIKLIDFGESRIGELKEFLPTMSNATCGTPNYMDPLMRYGGEGFHTKSDLWSLGVTFYEMLIGSQHDFNKDSSIDKIVRAARTLPLLLRRKQILSQLQEHINQLLLGRAFPMKIQNLLMGMLQINIQARWDWQQLFDVLNQELEQQNQFNATHLTEQQIKSNSTMKPLFNIIQILPVSFVSLSFKENAGPIITETYFKMITKGQQCVITAQKMMGQFRHQMSVGNEIGNNWQIFEKANYLLNMRSLIILNSLNQMLSLHIPQYGSESIDEQIWMDLIQPTNQPIYERIQLQIYYLYDNVRKLMQGSGLEMRMSVLTREDDEDNEYGTKLILDEEERRYFQYSKCDPKHKQNRAENFDDEGFVRLFNKYIKQAIELQMSIRNRESCQVCSQLLVCLGIEQFYRDFSWQRYQDYNSNLECNSVDLIWSKVRVCLNGM